MNNQVKSIVVLMTVLQKFTAHTIWVHAEIIPENKKSIVKINLGWSALHFNMFYLPFSRINNYLTINFFIDFFSSAESLFLVLAGNISHLWKLCLFFNFCDHIQGVTEPLTQSAISIWDVYTYQAWGGKVLVTCTPLVDFGVSYYS